MDVNNIIVYCRFVFIEVRRSDRRLVPTYVNDITIEFTKSSKQCHHRAFLLNIQIKLQNL